MVADTEQWRWQGLEVSGKRAAHRIEDISYTGTPHWLLCTDGTRLEADTPEALAAQWQSHGGKVFHFKNDIEDRQGQTESVDAMRQAFLSITQSLAETCECSPGSDIMACPNYLPGDEDEGAFDDND